MRVNDRLSQIYRTRAHGTSEAPTKNMTLAAAEPSPDETDRALHCTLHHPTQWKRPLFHDDVEMIWHHHECEYARSRTSRGFADVHRDRITQFFDEERCAILHTRSDMDALTGRVYSHGSWHVWKLAGSAGHIHARLERP